jgi:hypothetical protein
LYTISLDSAKTLHHWYSIHVIITYTIRKLKTMRHALHYPDKGVGKWALAGSIAILGALAFASIAKGEEPTVTTTVAQPDGE